MRTPEQKAQHAAYQRQWRKDNPEKAAAISRRRDERRKQDPERQAQHLERHAEWHREWKRKNPERAKRTQRDSYIRTHFGIEPEEYDRMLAGQHGVCAICKQEPGGRKKFLCVDHDHETGHVRGLLCDRCNRALGLPGDSAELLAAAIGYLKAA